MTAGARATRRSGLLAAGLLLCASPAFAAPPEPQGAPVPSETVVVTGQRLSKEQRGKVVWDFVYAHAKRAPKTDQLSRWTVPICLEVQNLPQGYASFIATRIKEVAGKAGARVGEASCKPNIEIVFTPDPQGFMDSVAKKNPVLLGFHFVHDTAKLAAVTRPIQAWYVTATSNRAATQIDDPYHAAAPGVPGSRLSRGQLSVFANVLIVIDANKAAGYPVGQIADYLAMLSLSQADAPDDCGELSSVLDLMAEECPRKPEALTATDTAYLEGLYALDPDEIGSLQQSAIANFIKRNGAE